MGTCCIAQELSSVLCDDLDGWWGGGRQIHEGGDTCILRIDSLLYSRNQYDTVPTIHQLRGKKKTGLGLSSEKQLVAAFRVFLPRWGLHFNEELINMWPTGKVQFCRDHKHHDLLVLREGLGWELKFPGSVGEEAEAQPGGFLKKSMLIMGVALGKFKQYNFMA